MTQPKLKRGLAAFAAATVMGAGLIGLTVSAPSVAAENVAGQPGTPSEYKLLFWEGFENRTSSWEFLGDYTGSEAANNGQGLNNEGIQYTSDTYWQSTNNCTGILMGSDLISKPSSTFCGTNNAWFNQVKLLIENLPNKDSQTAVASYTTGAATLPQDGVVVRTDPTTPISVPGSTDRFLTFGLDAAALNCYPSFASHAHPVLAFSYVDASGTEHLVADRLDTNGNLRDTTVANGILPSWLPSAASGYAYASQFSNWGAAPTARQNPNGWNVITNRDIPFYANNTTQFSKQYWTYTDTALINPCADFSSARSTVADPRGTTDLAAGSFINKSGFLNEGDTVQLILRNRAYTGSGNDGVIDNLKVYDVTPQLDVQYGNWDGTDSKHEGNNDSEMIRYTGESTITYTITNRSDLGSKFGWTFENTLPEGLEFAGDPVIAGAGAIDSATLNNWSFEGNNKFIFTDGYLDVNQQTLTITIPVRNVDPALANADIVKKYTTETASFTSVRGLDLPNPASIRWYNFEEKSEGLQGQPQTVTPTYVDANGTTVTPSVDNPAKLIDPTTGQPTDETTIPAMKDGKQIGTYTIDPLTGEITFQPNPDFIGTPDPVESAVLGQDGQPLINVYTPTVTPVTPTGTPVTSQGLQGAAQTGTPTFTGGDPLVPVTISADNPAKLIDPATGQPTDETTIPAMKDGKQVGTYTIDPATGIVTFQPNPDFVGTPDPATVQAKDANGTPATATYTPTVIGVTPTGTPVTSEGLQGQPQTGTPTFTPGDPSVPIELSATNPAQLIDPVTGEPTDETTIPAMKDGKQVGTYTIDPLTGVVTFQPNPDFIGTPDPAIVQVKDANGTPAQATYTPTVTPVVPVGTGVTSEGKQGASQTGQPTFTPGADIVPITISADNPAKLIDPATGQPTDETTIPAMKDGKQVGTYTIDPATGIVTFQPNPDFTGMPDPATVQAKDANGTPATATYQPFVTPLIPTGKGVTSENVQGKAQTGTPVFTDGEGNPLTPSADNPAKLIDPTTGQPTDETTIPAMKDGKQVGTYTIDPATGIVTFQPNPDFVGTPDPATVQVKDANGTPATATYQPIVTPVIPTGTGAASVGPMGAAQTGQPTFAPGADIVPITISADNPAKLIDPATGQPTDETTIPAMKDGKQVGTYTIDPATGIVTFQPNPDFIGTPDPAVVEAKDANGTPARASYQPLVYPNPGTAVGDASINVQGATQTGKVSFANYDGETIVPSAENPVRLIDPKTGEPTDSTTVPAMKDGKQVGTYTVDPLTGKVTFKPNPDFVGTPDPARLTMTDAAGNKLIATYQPKVIPAPKPVSPNPADPKPTPETPALSTPGKLAHTGASVVGISGVLVAMMLLGSSLLVLRRRRNQ